MSDSILRRARPVRFKTIGLHHVDNDDRLSWKAVGLLTYMLTRPDGWKFFRDEIVSRHSDGTAAVKSGLQELRDRGYLRTRPLSAGGWEWFVNDEPMSEAGWRAILSESDKVAEGRNPAGGISAGGKSTLITDRTIQQEELTDILLSEEPPPDSRPEDFEALWALCRRGSKKKAWEQYRKAVPDRTDHETVYRARIAYIEAQSEMRFVAHLDRWLRDGRWEEYAAAARPNGKSAAGRQVSPDSAARFY